MMFVIGQHRSVGAVDAGLVVFCLRRCKDLTDDDGGSGAVCHGAEDRVGSFAVGLQDDAYLLRQNDDLSIARGELLCLLGIESEQPVCVCARGRYVCVGCDEADLYLWLREARAPFPCRQASSRIRRSAGPGMRGSRRLAQRVVVG